MSGRYELTNITPEQRSELQREAALVRWENERKRRAYFEEHAADLLAFVIVCRARDRLADRESIRRIREHIGEVMPKP